MVNDVLEKSILHLGGTGNVSFLIYGPTFHRKCLTINQKYYLISYLYAFLNSSLVTIKFIIID